MARNKGHKECGACNVTSIVESHKCRKCGYCNKILTKHKRCKICRILLHKENEEYKCRCETQHSLAVGRYCVGCNKKNE